MRRAQPAAEGFEIPLRACEPLERPERVRDHRQLRERLTALDAHRRIGRRCAAEHAAWIERLANECRQSFARARRTGQDDEQPRVGLGQDLLAAPGGDPLELLLRIGGAQDFRDGPGVRLLLLLRGPRLTRGRDRAQARRERIEAPQQQPAAAARARRRDPREERAHARRAQRAAALVKRLLGLAQQSRLAVRGPGLERDTVVGGELARALQRLGQRAAVQEREAPRSRRRVLPPQEPLLGAREQPWPLARGRGCAALGLPPQPHRARVHIRARPGALARLERGGRVREPHRVRSLRGRHDEGAVIAQMLGYVSCKPKQNRLLESL